MTTGAPGRVFEDPPLDNSSDVNAVDLIDRLREALSGTAESPRPIADLRLPSPLAHFVAAENMARLRAAAVLVAIVPHAHGASLLMTRRSQDLREHKGQISFPGGARDSSDCSYVDTARREAFEEIGLPIASVEVIGFLDDYPVLSGYRITPVVGIVREQFVQRLQASEVAEVFELPLARVLAEDAFEHKILSRDGMEVPFWELNFGTYRIWGATAGILWNLRRCLLDAAE